MHETEVPALLPVLLFLGFFPYPTLRYRECQSAKNKVMGALGALGYSDLGSLSVFLLHCFIPVLIGPLSSVDTEKKRKKKV